MFGPAEFADSNISFTNMSTKLRMFSRCIKKTFISLILAAVMPYTQSEKSPILQSGIVRNPIPNPGKIVLLGGTFGLLSGRTPRMPTRASTKVRIQRFFVCY